MQIKRSKKRRKLSLKNLSTQLSLIAIGIPTLVLSVFGLYQVQTQTVSLENNLNIALKNEAVQLSASLSTVLFNFDDETCKVICKAALKKNEIIKIVIWDLDQEYLSFQDKHYALKHLEKGSKTIEFPIFFKTEKIGKIQIIATMSFLNEKIEALKFNGILQVVILDIILGLVLILILNLRFIRPLKSLQQSSEKIAAGNLDHHIDVHREDELGALAENLIIMRDAVKDKVESLQSEVDRHQETKNYIDNIINSMPSALLSLDQDFKITQCNHKAEKLYGIKAFEVISKPLDQVLPKMKPFMDNIKKAILTGNPYYLPKQVTKTSRGLTYEDITVYPLTAGNIEGVVIRVDDITEHVRMEEMVVQSEKMLSIGGLAAGMAHEINNPLAGMMQNAQVVLNRIQGEIPASEEAARKVGISMGQIRNFMENRGIIRQLQLIHEAGIRASQIVQNMLSFSRKDFSGKIRQDMALILDQTIELAKSDYDLKKQYDFKKIHIVREYQPDTPPVLCEVSKIQQVFFNILKNSAEAMQEVTSLKGAVFLLRIKKAGDFVCIEIEDNGPGMTEEIRKRVFEPFFTTKPVGKGTGLGLSVSYFIITDNHNGKMNIVSEPGKGAKFIIHLPIM